MSKKSGLHYLQEKPNNKQVDKNGKKLALVIIGEDAYSDDEYVIYNGNFAFQAKVTMHDDQCRATDKHVLENGYVLYDFVWQGSPPHGKQFDNAMNAVEQALESDLSKSGFMSGDDDDFSDME